MAIAVTRERSVDSPEKKKQKLLFCARAFSLDLRCTDINGKHDKQRREKFISKLYSSSIFSAYIQHTQYEGP